jgi:hypothetical protein
MNVTAIYNWKGHLTGYKRNNTFIPIDEGNRDYQIIQEEIANGTCIVDEPEIGEVTETYNQQGNLSGYRWNGVYVPIDENNRNYQLVKKAIEEDYCTVNKPFLDKSYVSALKIETIIFCPFFDQPWQHITDSEEGKITYRSHSKASYLDYDFRLINIQPSKNINGAKLLFEKHNISNELFPIEFPIKSGVLEFEVPVKHLLKLFRNEKQLLEEDKANFLEDCLSQHLVESGRASQEPDQSWLISFAKIYLENFVMEVGNRIIEAYTREYGTLPIGYIDKWKVHQETIVINKNRNGVFSIGNFGLQGKQSFNLSGGWRSNQSLRQVSQPEKYPTHPQAHALQKVRMLIKLGLHMEELCLLNAFIEVNVKTVLYHCMKSEHEAQKTILKMNHRQRLEILQKISKVTECNILFGNDYISRVKSAIEIYKHRNDYVHDLTLPDNQQNLTVKQRQGIERLMHGFIDVFESERWFGWQMRVASGEDTDAIGIIKQFSSKWAEARNKAK